MPETKRTRRDVAVEITDLIIRKLEEGVPLVAAMEHGSCRRPALAAMWNAIHWY